MSQASTPHISCGLPIERSHTFTQKGEHHPARRRHPFCHRGYHYFVLSSHILPSLLSRFTSSAPLLLVSLSLSGGFFPASTVLTLTAQGYTACLLRCLGLSHSLHRLVAIVSPGFCFLISLSALSCLPVCPALTLAAARITSPPRATPSPLPRHASPHSPVHIVHIAVPPSSGSHATAPATPCYRLVYFDHFEEPLAAKAGCVPKRQAWLRQMQQHQTPNSRRQHISSPLHPDGEGPVWCETTMLDLDRITANVECSPPPPPYSTLVPSHPPHLHTCRQSLPPPKL